MPATVVITIARQLGSGGSYVGQQVARRLGYAYIDRQILQQASKELGVEEAEIEGREGRLQSFWEKLLSGFTLATPFPLYVPPPLWITDEKLAEVERRLITDLAAKGPCVVLGRGAFHLLRGRARLLNIMVHAPLEFRVERVMSIYHAENWAKAVQVIERSDQDRRRYIRTFTGLDWFDTRNYDLTIDTGKIDFAAAEEMIASVAGHLPADEVWPWVNEPT
ncbi:MAG: AAA family ATPase [Syntrophobacteraceae bacterium]